MSFGRKNGPKLGPFTVQEPWLSSWSGLWRVLQQVESVVVFLLEDSGV
ncbi:unnamed protein product [Strongylus vulgaris]|uniref:Uncharacterized protein n=1 Tax=Strongylus vulgaris TaxID=40348 RepID=A0A3P7LHH8_STRVU|nr:unnamed protein product [Strongylus vulgaris]